MAIEVRMPRQGNTVESCLLVSWKKKEGETVSAGETLCEVETDKATFEVPAPESGTLLAVLGKEGEDVPVLDLIAVIGAPGEDISGILGGAKAAGHASKAAPAAWTGTPSAPAPVRAGGGAARAVSPRARRLADAEGVDVSALTGTGPGGRVIERDVRAALPKRGAATAAAAALAREASTASLQAPAASGAVTEIPVRGVRKLIAERMHSSLASTAQLTLDMSADATGILSYRAALKASEPGRGLSGITINDLVMFAVVRTMGSFPEMNAHFLGDRILRFSEVNLAFAADTPRGLVVPVIKNAGRLSLRELSAEARRLAEAAVSGKIDPEELAGGTFTVTNLGAMGIERFTPVLNPPQAAILGVCAIIPRPVEAEGGIRLVPYIGLSLTIDHQAVDGAPASRFLAALSTNIAHFDLLLAE